LLAVLDRLHGEKEICENESSSVTVREEDSSIVFEKRAPRKIFILTRKEITEKCKEFVMRSFMIYIITKYYWEA
jgi:hypothetical protein